jgi:hypothetical protein
MAERKKLSDILMNSERERLERLWKTTKPAAELRPLPSDDYRCRIVNGELFNAKKGTPGFKLTFEVLDGEHAGRRVWWDTWLSSEAAVAISLRELAKIGVTELTQLDSPPPDGIIVVAKVRLRRTEEETEYNSVVRFDVVAIEPQAPEPFAPIEEEPDDVNEVDTTDADGFDWSKGEHPNEGPTP